ncbi:hypothetical protein AgCh_007909 [Apium graveolens]
MGYGKIISENVVIDDVALVAGLEVNLLSVSQFADKGFEVLFNKEECTFISKKTGEVALKGARKGSLFVTDLDSTNKDGICCFYTKASEEQSKLWHKKLSHLNFKANNNLVKNELMRDMPKLEFGQIEVCEACKGIVQEFSAARTPQQNGVVERKNRTLIEVARTMLYLINKAHGKSPYSIMSTRKPAVKHFHVFGSKCYILKDNSEYVGKFDSRVFEAIFLGYSLERTAYKVYVTDQKKIMENTDVIFDDDKCPCLKCLDDNEAEALAFENLNIDSDSDGEVEVDAHQTLNEETTQQENHENGNSSQTPEFESTNSGGEREEESSSHTNNEENNEDTSQQTHTRKWDRSHTRDVIIGDPTAGVRTRSATANECLNACFLSQVEPKKIDEALLDPDWISAMQEELNQFERSKV